MSACILFFTYLSIYLSINLVAHPCFRYSNVQPWQFVEHMRIEQLRSDVSADFVGTFANYHCCQKNKRK